MVQDSQTSTIKDTEGNWFVIDEPYANPPWENLILDLTKPLSMKRQLTFTNIESIRVNENSIQTKNKEFIPLDNIFDVYSTLTSKFNHYLLTVYHPVELDRLIKLLGKRVAIDLISAEQVTWAHYQLYFTPNRNLTIRDLRNNTSVKIQPLYDWFSPMSYEELLKNVAESVSLGEDLIALTNISIILYKEIEIVTKTLPHSIASASAITDTYIEKPYKQIKRSEIPRQAYELAYKSFHAPWIEMLKTGRFKNLIEYDLNSAYPLEVANLIDISPSEGDWIFEEKSIPENSEYGFCYAYITIYNHVKVSPIFLRKSNKLFAAVGSWLGTITLDEIKFIEKYELGFVEVISGWYFVPHTISKPFKPSIYKYLNIRDIAKKKNDKFLELVIKSATVRFVGKFLQKTFDPLGTEFAEASPTFNSIYANIVMTRVKLKVAELAMFNPNSVANIIVDGLACTEPIDDDYLKKFSIKKKVISDIILVNPQLTYFTNPDRALLLEILKTDPTKTWYRLPSTQYKRLCESIVSDTFETIGDIKSDGINFEVGKDRKRFWPKQPKFGLDLLRYNFDSELHHTMNIDMMYPSFRDTETIESMRKIGYYLP